MRPALRFHAQMVGKEPTVLIPRDARPGSPGIRAARATRWLWSRGIYPGVAAVSIRMHGHARDLNDRETKARREEMFGLGIPFQRRGLSELLRTMHYDNRTNRMGDG